MRKCKQCKYYDNGACHRYPPVTVGGVVEFETLTMHPTVVGEDDWCGEYLQKLPSLSENVSRDTLNE
jgi:hypothetical protein